MTMNYAVSVLSIIYCYWWTEDKSLYLCVHVMQARAVVIAHYYYDTRYSAKRCD